MAGSEAMGTCQLATVDGRRPRVAVVGGSPAGGMVATVLCQQFGCDTASAATGEALLSLLRGSTPYDAVVLDLSVADMNAIVMVQLIRALGNRGDLPVVALTNHRGETSGPHARAADFAAAVVKPYSPRELFTAMQTALARSLRATAAGTA